MIDHVSSRKAKIGGSVVIRNENRDSVTGNDAGWLQCLFQ